MNAAVKKARTFSFDEADFSITVPANIPSAPRANELPFKAWYAKFAQEALDGKQPHLFVPHAYWTDAREVPAEKVTDGYSKTKLRDQFNGFKKVTEIKGVDALNIITLGRTGKEGITGIEEPGISLWLTKAT